jgi:hypothetical protein
MALALALRRLSSSVEKPIRPLLNATSHYYMVLNSLIVSVLELNA